MNISSSTSPFSLHNSPLARQKMQQKTKEDGIPSEKPTDALFFRIDVFV